MAHTSQATHSGGQATLRPGGARARGLKALIKLDYNHCKFKFKFNEATPRGVPGPVFKKTPEMPGFTKMTPPRLPAGVRSLCTSTSPALHTMPNKIENGKTLQANQLFFITDINLIKSKEIDKA